MLATYGWNCGRFMAKLYENQPSPVRKAWGLVDWASRMMLGFRVPGLGYRRRGLSM